MASAGSHALAPWALVISLAVTSACRIGFDELPPQLEPLSAFSAAANEGGNEGEIKVQYTLAPGAGSAELERIDLRRATGDDPPADCLDGDLIASITDLSASSFVDRIADRFIRVHSYRACLVDRSGNSLTSSDMTAAAVAYFNPAPRCSHPPCTPVSSSIPTLGGFARAPESLSATGDTGADLILTDVDQDDVLDAVVAAFGANVVHVGAGDGSFSGPRALSARTLSTVAAVAGDFDNDGLKDIVFANNDGNVDIVFSQDSNDVIGLLRGNGDGSFGDQIDLDDGDLYTTTNIEVGDLDRDGKIDFLIGVTAGASQAFLGL